MMLRAEPVESIKAMTEDIAKAVAAFRVSPNFDDDEVYRVLVRGGMQTQTASLLVNFLPMAYFRVVFTDRVAEISNEFCVHPSEGSPSAWRQLSSEPLWDEVMAFARSEVERGLAGKDAVMELLKRDATYKALCVALSKDPGATFKDIQCGPTVFPAEPDAGFED